MSEFTADYVRKHHAQELEDFAEEFDFDYTFAAEKLGEFIAEFEVERGIEEAWEWAAEYGGQHRGQYREHWDADELPLMEWAEPGVAYTMGPEGWESDDRPTPQY